MCRKSVHSSGSYLYRVAVFLSLFGKLWERRLRYFEQFIALASAFGEKLKQKITNVLVKAGVHVLTSFEAKKPTL